VLDKNKFHKNLNQTVQDGLTHPPHFMLLEYIQINPMAMIQIL